MALGLLHVHVFCSPCTQCFSSSRLMSAVMSSSHQPQCIRLTGWEEGHSFVYGFLKYIRIKDYSNICQSWIYFFYFCAIEPTVVCVEGFADTWSFKPYIYLICWTACGNRLVFCGAQPKNDTKMCLKGTIFKVGKPCAQQLSSVAFLSYICPVLPPVENKLCLLRKIWRILNCS